MLPSGNDAALTIAEVFGYLLYLEDNSDDNTIQEIRSKNCLITCKMR